MRVARARVLRSERRLDVLAPMTSRAGGEVNIEFRAAGRTESFTGEVQSTQDEGLGRLDLDEPIPRSQARLGTGIVTIDYPGDPDTRPQEVRLRAASRRARLEIDELSLEGDRLSASGQIASGARGLVRVELSYLDAAGQPQLFKSNVKIDDGAWALESDKVPREVAERGGYVSMLFTGYFERRIRGEMVSYQLNPDQTRRP
jgi:hypothetical protein